MTGLKIVLFIHGSFFSHLIWWLIIKCVKLMVLYLYFLFNVFNVYNELFSLCSTLNFFFNLTILLIINWHATYKPTSWFSWKTSTQYMFNAIHAHTTHQFIAKMWQHVLIKKVLHDSIFSRMSIFCLSFSFLLILLSFHSCSWCNQ